VGEDLDLKEARSQQKPILCVRFDGVIHEYNAGWRLASTVILGAPVKGAFSFLASADSFFCVCVVSERNIDPLSLRSVHRWFKQHGWPVVDRRPARLLFPQRQPESFISIDDRCLCFEGVFPEIVELSKFLSWKDRSTQE